MPEWSSKIKSSRKINYFSTLKTRWTIWGLPQVEFENQVENPLGISMPPIPSFLLLVCLIFQLPKNLLCWFSSICFTGQAYRNSSKIIFGVSIAKLFLKKGFLVMFFSYFVLKTKSENPGKTKNVLRWELCWLKLCYPRKLCSRKKFAWKLLCIIRTPL